MRERERERKCVYVCERVVCVNVCECVCYRVYECESL